MKERITNEAIFLIQQKGFSFTISDLAKNLGTSKRTIYQHFSSKDAIIDSIIENLILQIKNKEEEIVEKAKGILMDKYNLTEDRAFKKMRTISMKKQVTLEKLAKHIIEKYGT